MSKAAEGLTFQQLIGTVFVAVVLGAGAVLHGLAVEVAGLVVEVREQGRAIEAIARQLNADDRADAPGPPDRDPTR